MIRLDVPGVRPLAGLTCALAALIASAVEPACVRASPGIAHGAPSAAASTSPALAGTSWQLVRFQGGDGQLLIPDDGAKYTIEFGEGGEVNARIDCNRGRGAWSSSGPSQLQFGPLALTRAACLPGSLHDQIVTQWAYIRSFIVRDRRLFLSLMADGGIYEFEPIRKPGQ